MTDEAASAIAVIPARGGSKRVPRKNVRSFNGRPMIAWSIDAARASGCFGRVIVSTDDDEICEVSLRCGAEVPFTRPASLADDHATTASVIAHALEWAGTAGLVPQSACCIYATAPFLRPADIIAGKRLLDAGSRDFVFAATRFEAPVQRGFERLEDGSLRMLWPERFGARSQDLPPVFHDAAQFYWGTPEAWKAQLPVFGARSTFVEIPRWRSADIDTEEDWRRAELLAAATAMITPEGG
jgi:pseudaminic acid cytidylyltransferase